MKSIEISVSSPDVSAENLLKPITIVLASLVGYQHAKKVKLEEEMVIGLAVVPSIIRAYIYIPHQLH